MMDSGKKNRIKETYTSVGGHRNADGEWVERIDEHKRYLFNYKKDYQDLLINLQPVSKKQIPFTAFYCHQSGSHYEMNHTPSSDTNKFLLLSPHQPEIWLNFLTAYSFRLMEQAEVNDVKATNNTLLVLSEIWDSFSNNAYFYLACCFYYVKKETRQLAAAIWIQQALSENMDNHLLGQCLGKIAFRKYAPLKRFTDLATEQFLNVSPQHTQALETLLTAMIAEMHPTPVKNTKKLLELYREVLCQNQSTAPQGLLDKWRDVKSLKALCKL